jgi:hypothetical protein
MPTEGAASTSPAPARSVREALRQVDASARALRDAGQLDESWALLLAALEAALVQTRDLTLLVRKLQRERLGLRSERVANAQLALLFEALVEQGPLTEADVAREAETDATLEREITEAKKRAPPARTRPAGRRVRTRGCIPSTCLRPIASVRGAPGR